MIDLHSHILPGIDDGASSLEDSLAMAWQAYNSGVTSMVCTPHLHQGVFDNTTDVVRDKYRELVAHLKKHDCPLKLAYSMEVRISADIVNWIDSGDFPFLGSWEGQPVLLLELPHSHIPAGVDNLIKYLNKQGIQTVIAHPERNRDILADQNKINLLRNLGCLFQITAGSYIGRFGTVVKDMAFYLTSHNYASYVASDMHSIKRRPNDMAQAFNAINGAFSSELAEKLFLSVPSELTSQMSWQ